MNKLEKTITMTLAIVGGIAGPWGAYTAYDSSKFKQPFDEHSEIAKSFAAQIDSAEKRNDLEEVSQLAAKIRAARKPDPYKAKGIKYQDEVVKKKPGKQAAKIEGEI